MYDEYVYLMNLKIIINSSNYHLMTDMISVMGRESCTGWGDVIFLLKVVASGF